MHLADGSDPYLAPELTARSAEEPRPEWIKFFDASEMDALSSFL